MTVDKGWIERARMAALQDQRVQVECEIVAIRWEVGGSPPRSNEMRNQAVLDHLDREIAGLSGQPLGPPPVPRGRDD